MSDTQQKTADVASTATGNISQLDLSAWFPRFIAIVIDGIILGIVAYVISAFVLVSLVFGGGSYGFWLAWGYSLVYPFVIGVLAVVYFTILEVSWSASLGKRIMGLEVQSTSGGRINLNQAFIRNISKIYWIFLLLDWLVALVTPGPDRRQKYTDRIAGTTVVQVRQMFASVTGATKQ